MKLSTALKEKGISLWVKNNGEVICNHKQQEKDTTSPMCLSAYEMKKMKQKSYADRQKQAKRHKQDKAEDKTEEVA